MKSLFQYSSQRYRAIIIAICVCGLIGNTLYFCSMLRDLHADSAFNGSQGGAVAAWVLNMVVFIAVIILSISFGRHAAKLPVTDNNVRPQAMVKDERLAQLSTLSRHLLRIAEEEKAKLAHELHSEFGSCISVATMDISLVVAQLGDGSPELTARLEHAMAALKELITLKRQLIGELYPEMLESLGLSFSLTEYIKKFETVNHPVLHANICENLDQIDPAYTIIVFRMVQEAMRNAITHAQANNIWITLQSIDTGLLLLIVDDGKGIDPEVAYGPQSHGLIAMREQALILGGTFVLQRPDPGSGTEVRVQIPSSSYLVPV